MSVTEGIISWILWETVQAGRQASKQASGTSMPARLGPHPHPRPLPPLHPLQCPRLLHRLLQQCLHKVSRQAAQTQRQSYTKKMRMGQQRRPTAGVGAMRDNDSIACIALIQIFPS